MKRSLMTMFILLLSTVMFGQKQWTLRDCINYAMQNNITLQQERLQKKTVTETRKQSQAALFPSLQASTNQSVGYRPWLGTGTATVTNGTVNTTVNKTYYNGTYGLNASWTVWNGNQNRNQVKLNKVAEEQADLDIAETANNIQERIAQLYVQILYMTEAIKVHKESLETSKKNEERGKEIVAVGRMSKADLAQLTAQRATDEYNIVEAESNLAKYILELKQLLELTGEEKFEIVIPVTTDQQALTEIPSLTEVYEKALTLRPEIQNAKLDLQSSDLQMKIAKAGHMPIVSMTGSVGTSTNSMGSNKWGNQIKTNFDTSVGATISIPIFDNRKTKTAINKAKIQREQALLDIQSEQKELYSTIEEYWLDANTNQQKFKAAQSSVESEQASYELLSEQFQVGIKNIIELMTGKDKLLKAQQNMLQSKYMTILDLQLLKFYQGEPMDI